MVDLSRTTRLHAFDYLRTVNATRCERWHPGFPNELIKDEEWNIAEWTNAMQGEAGEAGNIAKKIRRLDCNRVGRKSEEDRDELIERLAEEVADTVIYADLVLAKIGVDLWSAIVKKFNKTSEEYGFPERL